MRHARAVLSRAAKIRTPGDAWRVLRWLTAAVRRRIAHDPGPQPGSGDAQGGTSPDTDTQPGETGPSADRVPPASYPLGAEISATGNRAAAVFAASARVGPPAADRHTDLLLADTQQDGHPPEPVCDGPSHPAVAVLSEMHPRMAVPAFDPVAVNPVGWTPDHEPDPDVLQARWPSAGPDAACIHPDRSLLDGLRRLHHVIDSADGPGDTAQRAGRLAALAAAGVVIRIAGDDPGLRLALGERLHDLMCNEAVARADSHQREQISISMRRLALRDHSLRARARQILATQGLEPPLPEVSVLLATRRPERLGAALDAVRAQNYPRLELVLALHGEGFPSGADVADLTGDLRCNVQVVRVEEDKTLGEVLNAGVAASAGTLLTKFDDDDHYAADHLWDLLLAREYSRATLVAKAPEYIYLSQDDTTVRVSKMRERFVPRPMAAGGVLMISRQDLDDAGGWRRVPRAVDTALAEDVALVGGSIYWTHGAGYLRVRQGDSHTWRVDDSFFTERASGKRQGRDLEFAGF